MLSLRASKATTLLVKRTNVAASSGAVRYASNTSSSQQPTPREAAPLARVSFSKRIANQTQPEESGMTAEQVAISGGPSANTVAMPRTAHGVPSYQTRNMPALWSTNQNPRANAMRGPRFEQTNYDLQPMPQSAMQMISEEPIRLVEQRIASCDGGGGSLGHPKVFINLDKPGPKACGYCGIRFERAVHEHDHH